MRKFPRRDHLNQSPGESPEGGIHHAGMPPRGRPSSRRGRPPRGSHYGRPGQPRGAPLGSQQSMRHRRPHIEHPSLERAHTTSKLPTQDSSNDNEALIRKFGSPSKSPGNRKSLWQIMTAGNSNEKEVSPKTIISESGSKQEESDPNIVTDKITTAIDTMNKKRKTTLNDYSEGEMRKSSRRKKNEESVIDDKNENTSEMELSSSKKEKRKKRSDKSDMTEPNRDENEDKENICETKNVNEIDSEKTFIDTSDLAKNQEPKNEEPVGDETEMKSKRMKKSSSQQDIHKRKKKLRNQSNSVSNVGSVDSYSPINSEIKSSSRNRSSNREGKRSLSSSRTDLRRKSMNDENNTISYSHRTLPVSVLNHVINEPWQETLKRKSTKIKKDNDSRKSKEILIEQKDVSVQEEENKSKPKHYKTSRQNNYSSTDESGRERSKSKDSFISKENVISGDTEQVSQNILQYHSSDEKKVSPSRKSMRKDNLKEKRHKKDKIKDSPSKIKNKTNIKALSVESSTEDESVEKFSREKNTSDSTRKRMIKDENFEEGHTSDEKPTLTRTRSSSYRIATLGQTNETAEDTTEKPQNSKESGGLKKKVLQNSSRTKMHRNSGSLRKSKLAKYRSEESEEPVKKNQNNDSTSEEKENCTISSPNKAVNEQVELSSVSVQNIAKVVSTKNKKQEKSDLSNDAGITDVSVRSEEQINIQPVSQEKSIDVPDINPENISNESELNITPNAALYHSNRDEYQHHHVRGRRYHRGARTQSFRGRRKYPIENHMHQVSPSGDANISQFPLNPASHRGRPSNRGRKFNAAATQSNLPTRGRMPRRGSHRFVRSHSMPGGEDRGINNLKDDNNVSLPVPGDNHDATIKRKKSIIQRIKEFFGIYKNTDDSSDEDSSSEESSTEEESSIKSGSQLSLPDITSEGIKSRSADGKDSSHHRRTQSATDLRRKNRKLEKNDEITRLTSPSKMEVSAFKRMFSLRDSFKRKKVYEKDTGSSSDASETEESEETDEDSEKRSSSMSETVTQVKDGKRIESDLIQNDDEIRMEERTHTEKNHKYITQKESSLNKIRSPNPFIKKESVKRENEESTSASEEKEFDSDSSEDSTESEESEDESHHNTSGAKKPFQQFWRKLKGKKESESEDESQYTSEESVDSGHSENSDSETDSGEEYEVNHELNYPASSAAPDMDHSSKSYIEGIRKESLISSDDQEVHEGGQRYKIPPRLRVVDLNSSSSSYTDEMRGEHSQYIHNQQTDNVKPQYRNLSKPLMADIHSPSRSYTEHVREENPKYSYNQEKYKTQQEYRNPTRTVVKKLSSSSGSYSEEITVKSGKFSYNQDVNLNVINYRQDIQQRNRYEINSSQERDIDTLEHHESSRSDVSLEAVGTNKPVSTLTRSDALDDIQTFHFNRNHEIEPVTPVYESFRSEQFTVKSKPIRRLKSQKSTEIIVHNNPHENSPLTNDDMHFSDLPGYQQYDGTVELLPVSKIKQITPSSELKVNTNCDDSESHRQTKKLSSFTQIYDDDESKSADTALVNNDDEVKTNDNQFSISSVEYRRPLSYQIEPKTHGGFDLSRKKISNDPHNAPNNNSDLESYRAVNSRPYSEMWNMKGNHSEYDSYGDTSDDSPTKRVKRKSIPPESYQIFKSKPSPVNKTNVSRQSSVEHSRDMFEQHKNAGMEYLQKSQQHSLKRSQSQQRTEMKGETVDNDKLEDRTPSQFAVPSPLENGLVVYKIIEDLNEKNTDNALTKLPRESEEEPNKIKEISSKIILLPARVTTRDNPNTGRSLSKERLTENENKYNYIKDRSSPSNKESSLKMFNSNSLLSSKSHLESSLSLPPSITKIVATKMKSSPVIPIADTLWNREDNLHTKNSFESKILSDESSRSSSPIKKDENRIVDDTITIEPTVTLDKKIVNECDRCSGVSENSRKEVKSSPKPAVTIFRVPRKPLISHRPSNSTNSSSVTITPISGSNENLSYTLFSKKHSSTISLIPIGNPSPEKKTVETQIFVEKGTQVNPFEKSSSDESSSKSDLTENKEDKNFVLSKAITQGDEKPIKDPPATPQGGEKIIKDLHATPQGDKRTIKDLPATPQGDEKSQKAFSDVPIPVIGKIPNSAEVVNSMSDIKKKELPATFLTSYKYQTPFSSTYAPSYKRWITPTPYTSKQTNHSAVSYSSKPPSSLSSALLSKHFSSLPGPTFKLSRATNSTDEDVESMSSDNAIKKTSLEVTKTLSTSDSLMDNFSSSTSSSPPPTPPLSPSYFSPKVKDKYISNSVSEPQEKDFVPVTQVITKTINIRKLTPEKVNITHLSLPTIREGKNVVKPSVAPPPPPLRLNLQSSSIAKDKVAYSPSPPPLPATSPPPLEANNFYLIH